MIQLENGMVSVTTYIEFLNYLNIFRLLFEARNKKKPDMKSNTSMSSQEDTTSTIAYLDASTSTGNTGTTGIMTNTTIPMSIEPKLPINKPVPEPDVKTFYRRATKTKPKIKEFYTTDELRRLILGEPIYIVS